MGRVRPDPARCGRALGTAGEEIGSGETEFRTTGSVSLIFDRTDASQSPPGFIMPPAPPTRVLQPGSYKEGT